MTNRNSKYMPLQDSHNTLGATGSSPSGNVQTKPKRTTKTSQKLTLFPKDVLPEDEAATPSNLPHVKESEPEALLSRLERRWLPRVTGYCTANSYRMDALYDFLVSRGQSNQTAPKRFDEAIYTPFTPLVLGRAAVEVLVDTTGSVDPNGDPPSPNRSLNSFLVQNVDSKGHQLPSNLPHSDLAKQIAPIGDLVFFDYGVVVMWGLTEDEEHSVLRFLKQFEEEKLKDIDIETEQLHFHYNQNSQPRIYNDVITLRASNEMLKLTISHAIAQSVKLAVFEELIEETIDSTRNVPSVLAETGKIMLPRKAINQKIGELFIMRINVNLVSNVLDTPEIFWSEPSLEPIYTAIRGYLEINQRVELLNQRTSVISDLLDMLKEHLNSRHGEQLEWIVIILIAFELLIGLITILFDWVGYQQKHRTA